MDEIIDLDRFWIFPPEYEEVFKAFFVVGEEFGIIVSISIEV